MPRIHPRLVRKARQVHPDLARILPICRDLRSAHSELKWMRDYAGTIFQESSATTRRRGLQELVVRRSRGEPLQYILGTEFFGDLEIQCRSGVLIPRPETAASVTHLVHLLVSYLPGLPSHLRVLDLCTGTGCIPLLFQHEFHRMRDQHESIQDDVRLDLTGVDISPSSLALAEENRARQLKSLESGNCSVDPSYRSLQGLTLLRADVLADEASSPNAGAPPLLEALRDSEKSQHLNYDILISNPPYISAKDYWRTTSPSVRRYEPSIALVPPESGQRSLHEDNPADVFYHKILAVATQLDVQIMLLEVADLDQAKRVANIAVHQDMWTGIDFWRDDPASGPPSPLDPEANGDKRTCLITLPTVGVGNARSVLLYRGEGARWLGKRR